MHSVAEVVEPLLKMSFDDFTCQRSHPINHAVNLRLVRQTVRIIRSVEIANGRAPSLYRQIYLSSRHVHARSSAFRSSAIRSLHFAIRILHFAFLHSAFYILHFAFRNPQSAFYISQSAFRSNVGSSAASAGSVRNIAKEGRRTKSAESCLRLEFPPSSLLRHSLTHYSTDFPTRAHTSQQTHSLIFPSQMNTTYSHLRLHTYTHTRFAALSIYGNALFM